MIIVKSIIGYGAPTKQGSHSAHGEPLGVEEVRGAKRFYGWPEDETFLVPDKVLSHFADLSKRGADARSAWDELFAAYGKEYPGLADHLDKMQRRQLPEDWDADLPEYPADPKGAAGRDTNQKVLNIVAQRVPWLIGGSSDLAPSNKSRLTFEGAGDFQPDNRAGRNLHFGVREHAAGAVTNGLSLSKIKAFQAGFLIFSDFQRGALRLSALMELPVIHMFTHDSIGVGEDGPTHQPVEHLASLRAMPGMIDMRPADANEVVEAWRVIMPPARPGGADLVPAGVADPRPQQVCAGKWPSQGAYVLAGDPSETPEVILIATGSEVALQCPLTSSWPMRESRPGS